MPDRPVRDVLGEAEAGRRLYEADVARRPLNHDWRPRKAWGDLSDIARSPWIILARLAEAGYRIVKEGEG